MMLDQPVPVWLIDERFGLYFTGRVVIDFADIRMAVAEFDLDCGKRRFLIAYSYIFLRESLTDEEAAHVQF